MPIRKLLVVLFCLCSSAAWAADVPVQVRIFGGSVQVEPEALNTELEAEGLKTFGTVTRAGIEVLYPLFRFLDVGVRYSGRDRTRDESPSTFSTNYETVLSQQGYLGLIRIPFVKSTFLRMDAFAGMGGMNTSITMKSAAKDGEYYDKEPLQWFGTVYSAAGGSIAIGYKSFYLFFESGYESNKIDRLFYKGTVNQNIKEIDLSGHYFAVGLLFDGLSASKKK